MAEIPIHKIGGGADTAELTAVPGDVLTPEIFLGSGSDENQQGTIVTQGSPSYSLPINGTQSIQPGYYTGGSVTQSIPTMGAQSVGPGSQMITIPTAGKYMTGNITIRTTHNLIPSVIKKNTVVGGVTGTFEGYVITDPNTLYKYGTFNGIQTITAFKYKLYDNAGVVTLQRDNIQTYVSNTLHQTAIVFDSPIDITNLSSLTVRMQANTSNPYWGGISLNRNKVTNYIFDNASSTNLVLNPDLGDQVDGMNVTSSGGDYTINLSGKTGIIYLYLFFYGGSQSITSNVYLVQFE